MAQWEVAPCEAACAAPCPPASRPTTIGQAPGFGPASALCLPHRPPQAAMLAFGVPLRWCRAIRRGFQMSAAHIPHGPSALCSWAARARGSNSRLGSVDLG
ncbi:unnamed protein product [Rangifer tarandus platyrhynchus]|uniref:Uncharacterized protein n=2 Tax=Rangifer tarandus platyrhynchus TaxID=3082113 RepID=A0ABN8YA97_RANTA|nr:unnamed protein product [Rangifer tarandus platyrhynchus]